MAILALFHFLWFALVCLALTSAAEDMPEQGLQEEAGDQRLVFAAGEGDLARVEALIAEGVDVNQASAAGETPLHVAGIFCKDGVVEALLNARANVNVKTNSGEGMAMTPLHWYVNMNPCRIHHVRLLLQARADQFAKNTQGMTPLDMVSRIQNRQHIAALLRDPEGEHVDPEPAIEDDSETLGARATEAASDWDEL